MCLPPRSRLLAAGVWLGLSLILGFVLALLSNPLRTGPLEPLVDGKRLSQILHSDAPDFEWMPNDSTFKRDAGKLDKPLAAGSESRDRHQRLKSEKRRSKPAERPCDRELFC